MSRADGGEAMYEVDMNSRPPRLHYPRGNFSVRTGSQLKEHCGSLGRAFALGPLAVKGPIRLSFALALFLRFLTGVRKPLGASDILPEAYRPSQTAHLLLFPFRDKQYRDNRVVLHFRIRPNRSRAITAPTYAMQLSPYYNNRLQ